MSLAGELRGEEKPLRPQAGASSLSVPSVVVMRSIRGGKTLRRLGIVSTLIDAAAAFARRDTRTGFLLLGAALASRWVPGLGVVVSVFTRLYRKVRRDGGAGLGETELLEQGVVPAGQVAER